MSNVIEVVEVEIDGRLIRVERLGDGTFRRPAYLKGATRKVIKKGKGADKPLPEMTEEQIAERIGPSIMGSTVGINTPAFNARIGEVTEPATPEAKKWDGWGTQLKPAVEVWWLCRKPIAEKNIVSQVLATGTGAINIDGSRIGSGGDKGVWPVTDRTSGRGSMAGPLEASETDQTKGRWPANLLLSHVKYVWYALRHDVPDEVVQAVHAYYGVDEALRTGGVPGGDSWDALGASEAKVLYPGVLRLVPARGSREDVGGPNLSEPEMRQVLQGDPRVGTHGTQEVLLEGVSARNGATQNAAGEGTHPGSSAEDVRSRVGEPLDGSVVAVEGGSVHGLSGVHAPDDRHVAAGGPDPHSAHDQEQVHHGASARDGSKARSSVGKGRTGASSKRGQRRQSPGEPHRRDVGRTQPEAPRDGNRTASAPRGEPRLEVTLGAIPDGWRTYFVEAAVGGCRRVGTQTVEAPVINRFTDGMKPFGDAVGSPYETTGGGTEERAVYECEPGCMVRKLDEQSGVLKSGTLKPDAYTGRPEFRDNGSIFAGAGQFENKGYPSDSGGASRFFQNFEPDYDVPFFYTGKASKADKNADLGPVNPAEEGQTNKHPTVKGQALCRYLVKLVTPPGGIVLDPFAGSGSTLVAATTEGFKFIGIEREAEYFQIAVKRTEKARERAEERFLQQSVFDAMAELEQE